MLSFLSQQPYFQIAVDALHLFILCFQETNLSPISNSSISGYQPPLSYDCPVCHGGGVAMFLHASLPFFQVPLSVPLQAVTARVLLSRYMVTICTSRYSHITGIYSILRSAHNDGIQCHVVYCNKTEDDILLRDELDNFGEIQHCLSRPKEGWTGYSGHITQTLMESVHDGFLICSGPSGMVDSVRKIAEASGWNVEKQLILT